MQGMWAQVNIQGWLCLCQVLQGSAQNVPNPAVALHPR